MQRWPRRAGRRWSSPRRRSGTPPPRPRPAGRRGRRPRRSPAGRAARPAGAARRPGRGRRARAAAGRARDGVRRRRRPGRAGWWRPTWALAASGSLSTSSRADSSWKTTPLSAGPSPSCRSRRIRRRSSSRAATSRSRLSWSSSASRLVRAAVAAWRTRSPSSSSSRRDSRLRSPRAGSTSRPTSVVAVGDRQGADVGRALAVRRDQPLAAAPVDLDADEADPERAGDGARDRGQLLGCPRRRSRGWRPGRRRRRTGWPGRRGPAGAPSARAAAAAGRRAGPSAAARRGPPAAAPGSRRGRRQHGDHDEVDDDQHERERGDDDGPAEQVLDRDQRGLTIATVIAIGTSVIATKNDGVA